MGKCWRRWKIGGAALGLIGAVAAAWAYYVFVAGNFHTVVAGQCYRSGQLSTAALEQTLAEYRISTVINLRGPNPKFEWYQQQLCVIKQHGKSSIDLCVGGCYVPSEAAIGRLVQALDDSAPPLLLHCGTGADRTGLASAFYKLLNTDANLEGACGEMSISFGHNPFGRARCLDCVLDSYRRWLEQEHSTHTRQRFRAWITKIYNREEIIQRYDLPREPDGD